MNTEIEWKVVEMLPHLLVSSHGDVFSNRFNRLLKGSLSGKGQNNKYLTIGYVTCNNNKKLVKFLKVHRMIAEAFIPNPENKPCVNHIDGNKLNNRASNLEWATHKENSVHAMETGLCNIRGELSPNSKLSNTSITEIRSLYSSGFSQSELARKFNVHQGTIWRIVSGLTYKTA